MTIEETIEKLEFMKRAYQELRDAGITDGIVSGNAGEIKGEWHSDGHVVLEAYQKHIDALDMAIKTLEKEPKTEWIPFTYRHATDEEKKDYAERTGYDEEDIDIILNCQLPEDRETVLITDRLGNVEVDTFINDCDGCYFDCNCDMEDVRAWMPLPEPYKESEG